MTLFQVAARDVSERTHARDAQPPPVEGIVCGRDSHRRRRSTCRIKLSEGVFIAKKKVAALSGSDLAFLCICRAAIVVVRRSTPREARRISRSGR